MLDFLKNIFSESETEKKKEELRDRHVSEVAVKAGWEYDYAEEQRKMRRSILESTFLIIKSTSSLNCHLKSKLRNITPFSIKKMIRFKRK